MGNIPVISTANGKVLVNWPKTLSVVRQTVEIASLERFAESRN